jgi:hypothetical protein
MNCHECGKKLGQVYCQNTFGGAFCSGTCAKANEQKAVEMPTIPLIKEYNEPPHYHKYEIDTIEFLQKGFPPEVFKGFAIGSIVKYLHRHTEKNGLEDLLKAEDYAKRLFQFAKEIDK